MTIWMQLSVWIPIKLTQGKCSSRLGTFKHSKSRLPRKQRIMKLSRPKKTLEIIKLTKTSQDHNLKDHVKNPALLQSQNRVKSSWFRTTCQKQYQRIRAIHFREM